MRVKEEVKPLAPEAHRISVNNTTATASPIESSKKLRNRKCLNCCACTTAVFVILGVVTLVLMLTVFKVKDPELKLNSVTIKGLEGINPLNPFPTDNLINLTTIADLSIKNPNAASFKFRNATTSIYYDNMLIGEVNTPQGIAKARRTFQMKATIDLMLEVDDIVRVPRFLGDLMTGSLPVTSQTSIRGKVEVMKIFRKTIGVRMDCTLKYSVAKQEIEDQKCKRYVSL